MNGVLGALVGLQQQVAGGVGVMDALAVAALALALVTLALDIWFFVLTTKAQRELLHDQGEVFASMREVLAQISERAHIVQEQVQHQSDRMLTALTSRVAAQAEATGSELSEGLQTKIEAVEATVAGLSRTQASTETVAALQRELRELRSQVASLPTQMAGTAIASSESLRDKLSTQVSSSPNVLDYASAARLRRRPDDRTGISAELARTWLAEGIGTVVEAIIAELAQSTRDNVVNLGEILRKSERFGLLDPDPVLRILEALRLAKKVSVVPSGDVYDKSAYAVRLTNSYRAELMKRFQSSRAGSAKDEATPAGGAGTSTGED